MRDESTGTRVGGTWLAIASVLMIITLVIHGPMAPEVSDQMTRISDHAAAWTLAHWTAAASLSFFAVAGLIILTSRSSLTDGPWRMSAWAVLLIGGLWTLNAAVVEATVMRNAAVSGSTEMFEAWWAYAEGRANGIVFLVLALAVIAAGDARGAPRATPAWVGWTAMVAGIASCTGWALGTWLEVGAGSRLWVAASILVCAWAAWFGFALARSPASAPLDAASPVPPATRAAYQDA